MSRRRSQSTPNPVTPEATPEEAVEPMPGTESSEETRETVSAASVGAIGPDGAPPVDGEPADETPARPTVDGRPACYLVDKCGLPEFMDGAGLCGAHWVHRPDLRKVARHG